MRRLFCLGLMLLAPLPALAQEAGVWLDLSIRVFTPLPAESASTETPADEPADPLSEQQVREAEARYLSTLLRLQLEASQQFGAVRVLPFTDIGAPLSISGRVLASDGRTLELAIEARDIRGRLWIDRSYRADATDTVSLSGDVLAEDPFSSLFAAIERDLLEALDTLAPEERQSLNRVALLRYGEQLLPDYASGYLAEDETGLLQAVRLPAENDPMLSRIRSIREREYRFIDIVDQQYRDFFADIRPVYLMWRELQREQRTSADAFIARRREQGNPYRPGSYFALRESYNDYRWTRVAEQYRQELNQGFDNEVEDTEIELEDSLFKLNGTLEQQYREWRSILAELFRLEYGISTE